MKSLSYQEAVLLLPLVVDGEATESERAAFFESMNQYPGLREEYQTAVQIKEIIKQKLPRYSAPDHLKKSILFKLENLALKEIAADSAEKKEVFKREPFRQQINGNPKKTKGILFRYISAAAVILIITLATLRLLDQITSDTSSEEIFIVENVAAYHFQLAGGQLIEPQWHIHSVTDAEALLSEQYDLNLTVPPIYGAHFAGIVMSEFVENYQAPLLEYVQEDLGETIYIFVLDVNDITTHKKLKRHDEAVKNCVNSHDFYVSEIDGHHVVSWMWENNWYTAISNHNGYDLASLIVPLNP